MASVEHARRDSATPLIQRVVIERYDVFDSTTNAWWARLANSIHVTTRSNVIARELLLAEGDPVDSTRMAESARTLRALRLFRHVTVDTATSDTGVALRVVTCDAWTTKFDAKLGITGSQTVFSVSASEANLLGTGAQVGVAFTHDPDRNTFRYQFAVPRLLRGRADLLLYHEELSDGRNSGTRIQAPFRTLETPDAASLAGRVFDGTVLRFTNGNPEPSEELRYLLAGGRVSLEHAFRADLARYARGGVSVQVRRDDFVDIATTTEIPRSVSVAATLHAEWSRAKFVVARFVRALGTQEDVDLSTVARIGASIAPRAWGYERDGVGPLFDARTGFQVAQHFLTLRATGTTLVTSSGLDSGTFTISAIGSVRPAERHTITLFGGAIRDVRGAPDQDVDLGLSRGPRAFEAHAFTGDRGYFFMAEYRWTVIENVLGLASMAVSGFAERGGAWFSGDPRRSGSAAGIGLRFGGSLGSSPKASRVDLARRFATDVQPAGWVLVLGSGFPYEKLWSAAGGALPQ